MTAKHKHFLISQKFPTWRQHAMSGTLFQPIRRWYNTIQFYLVIHSNKPQDGPFGRSTTILTAMGFAGSKLSAQGNLRSADYRSTAATGFQTPHLSCQSRFQLSGIAHPPHGESSYPQRFS
ncbi:hypothetical protein [Hallella colorans]|uniref:hypothetical protein n=1 Tax=Hallella colorans TaxID=1703337 RepID=UPI0023F028D4|nr:hypothetical protein [Hallella colorans]